MRTTTIIDELLKKVRNQNKDYLKSLCGLPISPYFSALKMKWLLNNIQQVQEAVKDNRCMFGTVDSWLIWVYFVFFFFFSISPFDQNIFGCLFKV